MKRYILISCLLPVALRGSLLGCLRVKQILKKNCFGGRPEIIPETQGREKVKRRPGGGGRTGPARARMKGVSFFHLYQIVAGSGDQGQAPKQGPIMSGQEGEVPLLPWQSSPGWPDASCSLDPFAGSLCTQSSELVCKHQTVRHDLLHTAGC